MHIITVPSITKSNQPGSFKQKQKKKNKNQGNNKEMWPSNVNGKIYQPGQYLAKGEFIF